MIRYIVWALSVLLPAGCAFADTIGTVALNTSSLSGGPFTIDFQFISGGTDNDNTVTLSNFAFGGGSATAGSTVRRRYGHFPSAAGRYAEYGIHGRSI